MCVYACVCACGHAPVHVCLFLWSTEDTPVLSSRLLIPVLSQSLLSSIKSFLSLLEIVFILIKLLCIHLFIYIPHAMPWVYSAWSFRHTANRQWPYLLHLDEFVSLIQLQICMYPTACPLHWVCRHASEGGLNNVPMKFIF